MGAGATAIPCGTRVADALTRAELTQCAHRNRPLRYNGRGVVTLCADDVLYLPVTTEISSLPQLTPEGLPLALARRAAEQTRMVNAVAKLEERGEAVTARALAAAARISLNTACAWLRQRETGTPESEAMLSTVPYSSHSISNNISAADHSTCAEALEGAPVSVDPLAAAPAPASIELNAPARPTVCPAASHQLLWQCPACGTRVPSPNAKLLSNTGPFLGNCA